MASDPDRKSACPECQPEGRAEHPMSMFEHAQALSSKRYMYGVDVNNYSMLIKLHSPDGSLGVADVGATSCRVFVATEGLLRMCMAHRGAFVVAAVR